MTKEERALLNRAMTIDAFLLVIDAMIESGRYAQARIEIAKVRVALGNAKMNITEK